MLRSKSSIGWRGGGEPCTRPLLGHVQGQVGWSPNQLAPNPSSAQCRHCDKQSTASYERHNIYLATVAHSSRGHAQARVGVKYGTKGPFPPTPSQEPVRKYIQHLNCFLGWAAPSNHERVTSCRLCSLRLPRPTRYRWLGPSGHWTRSWGGSGVVGWRESPLSPGAAALGPPCDPGARASRGAAPKGGAFLRNVKSWGFA